MLSTKVENVEDTGSGVRVTVSPAAGGDSQVLEADKMLAAFGFAPRLEGYGLEAAGVQTTERGAIAIDEYMRTNVPNVYAIGDVTGKFMLAHVAEAMGIVAAETIAGAETMPINYDMVPRATYCQPQIGSFGYSEAQAKEKGYDVKTATFPFSANGKAQGLGDAVGFVKVVADAKYNEILGAHMIGPGGDRAAAGADAGPAVGPDRRRGGPQRVRPPDPDRGDQGVGARHRRPHDQSLMEHTGQRIVVIGGGPGGYEAALVAAQLGSYVTVVDRDGLGGSAVLTDCVPSKTLIATSDLMTDVAGSAELGVRLTDHEGDAATTVTVDLAMVNRRVKQLASDQSADIASRLAKEGVDVISGRGELAGTDSVMVTTDGKEQILRADLVLVATGAAPRTLPGAQPDGERILTWEQVYDLDEVPSHLIVVGSGVTGAEFASAYLSLGIDVTLVSSRDRVLPGEDADAAAVLEDVLTRRGMHVLSKSRMASVERHGDTVTVTLTDGRTVEGSHCILALGSVPNTSGLGLEEAGRPARRRRLHLRRPGLAHHGAWRVRRRRLHRGPDARLGRRHAGADRHVALPGRQGVPARPHPGLLERLHSPEIATVGWSQRAVDAGEVQAVQVTLPLAGNARAKMQGVHDGFVKLFCRPGTGLIEGGVIVAPRASELIHPVALAVSERLTADQLAHAFTVYPSMSGSVAEAARRLHRSVSRVLRGSS